MRNGLGEPAQYDNPSWPRYIRTTDFAGPRTLRPETFASLPPQVAALAPVQRGDLLMSAAGTVGRTLLYESDDPACFAGYLVRFRPGADVDAGFISYWTESPVFRDQVEMGKVRSTIDNFSAGKYQNLIISLPSRSQQRATADYLDTETARIDALIDKKETLRARLLERHGSQRSEALLRGIDPVDGSGAIPNGWRVGSLGTVARLQRGLDLPDSARRPGGVPIVSSGGRSGWHDVVGVRGPGAITGRYGTVGTVYWEPGGYWPLNTTLYVRDFAGNDPRWVYHLLAAVPLDLDSAKSAVTGINRNVVGQLRVPIPPLEEQQRLAIQLDADAERCSQTVAALDQQLALIREHRQALITAAVTGELEVPGVAS